jgi:uncharacterized protein (TIGR03435 family)
MDFDPNFMDRFRIFVRMRKQNMSQTFLFATAAAFLPIFAAAQTAPSHLEFEVASIRPAAPLDASVKIGMHIDGSQVRFTDLSVRDFMRLAWQIKDYQVVGPDWIAAVRWDITAKLPAGANADQVPEMLQNLLADRFKITFHRDKKEFAVYALVAAKDGLRLKETAPDPASDGAAAPAKPGMNVSATGSAAGVFVDLGQGSWYTFADNKLIGHKLTMGRIADTLSRYMDKPVVDMTGAPANTYYDLSFDITPDDYRTMLIRSAISAGVTLPPGAERLADAPTDSLSAAMEGAGLKMDSRKAPLDVMMIDHAEKTPTEN